MDYQNEEISKTGRQILRMILGTLALIVGSYFFYSVLSSYFKINNIQAGFNSNFIWFLMFCCSVGVLIITSVVFIFGILNIKTVPIDDGAKTMKGGNTAVKFQTHSSQVRVKSADKTVEQKNKKEEIKMEKIDFQTMKKTAEQGDATVQRLLGSMYLNGQGVQQNIQEAELWYRKAAEQEDVIAQYELGKMLYKGKDGLQNQTEGIELLEKASQKNYGDAQCLLGNIYWDKQNFVEAYKLYERGVWNIVEPNDKSELILATVNLGMAYMKGLGCEKELEVAAMIFDKASLTAAQIGDKEFAKELSELSDTCTRQHHDTKKGCFITTATCEFFGKRDDCYELNTFRKFRDNWLVKQDDGKSIIEQYYNIAPKIVETINKIIERKTIYLKIWNEHLSPCLKLIETGKYAECKQKYMEMVEGLRERFGK